MDDETHSDYAETTGDESVRRNKDNGDVPTTTDSSPPTLQELRAHGRTTFIGGASSTGGDTFMPLATLVRKRLTADGAGRVAKFVKATVSWFRQQYPGKPVYQVGVNLLLVSDASLQQPQQRTKPEALADFRRLSPTVETPETSAWVVAGNLARERRELEAALRKGNKPLLWVYYANGYRDDPDIAITEHVATWRLVRAHLSPNKKRSHPSQTRCAIIRHVILE
jgi:hypothetical protein